MGAEVYSVFPHTCRRRHQNAVVFNVDIIIVGVSSESFTRSSGMGRLQNVVSYLSAACFPMLKKYSVYVHYAVVCSCHGDVIAEPVNNFWTLLKIITEACYQRTHRRVDPPLLAKRAVTEHLSQNRGWVSKAAFKTRFLSSTTFSTIVHIGVTMPIPCDDDRSYTIGKMVCRKKPNPAVIQNDRKTRKIL